METDIVIYGKGDFAKLILHYFNTDSDYNVVAFCVDSKYLDSDSFCDLPLFAFEDIEQKCPPKKTEAFVAVGYSNMRARKIMFDKIKSKNYKCINYISSKSIIDSSVEVGENNVIFSNTVVEPFVKIKDNNIIWSSCNICHNVNIESHSFIASQSLIGGFSSVKDSCFLGFNSTVLQNVTLAKETLVGAKSLILNNTEEHGKYLGSPARNIGNHKEQGIGIK